MCELREPGETRRDRRIAALEAEVESLRSALDIACAALELDDQADDDDPTPRKDG